jgi:hypothetical protein
MTTMPDFAIRATWPGLLTEDAEERLLALAPGTVLSHPRDGGTAVAIPLTADDVHEAARRLTGWTATLEICAGLVPYSLSIDPLED